MDKLDFTFGNAAGTVKTAEQMEPLLRSPVTEITIGSYTLEPREGNPTPNYWSDRQGSNSVSLNSLGLPNRGIRSIEQNLPAIFEACKKAGKNLRVSVAGFSVDEFLGLTRWAFGFPFAEIEINFGCPNVHGNRGQKPIFAFNVADMREVLSKLKNMPDTKKRLALKLSPYSDPVLLASVAKMARDFADLLSSLVVCNTFPNAYAFGQNGKPVFGLYKWAGLGGKPMKHIALGQVNQFAPPVTPIKVKGVGGIGSGTDLIDMLDAGASGVQVATAFLEQGPRVFSDILQEFADHQEMMKATSI